MRVPEGAEAHLDARGGDGGGLGEGEHFCVGGFVCGGDDGREGSASARRSFVRSIDRSIVAFYFSGSGSSDARARAGFESARARRRRRRAIRASRARVLRAYLTTDELRVR